MKIQVILIPWIQEKLPVTLSLYLSLSISALPFFISLFSPSFFITFFTFYLYLSHSEDSLFSNLVRKITKNQEKRERRWFLLKMMTFHYRIEGEMKELGRILCSLAETNDALHANGDDINQNILLQLISI